MESPIYLGTEKPGKLLLKFAVPCIFSLIISCLYNIVDQIFVGNGVGYLGNAATGVIFPVTVIGWGISLFFGDGAAAALSVSLGKNETEHIHRSVGNSILCSFLGGAALILISYIWGDGLLRLIGATDANLALAHDYGFIIYTMIPLALAQNTMASIAVTAVVMLRLWNQLKAEDVQPGAERPILQSSRPGVIVTIAREHGTAGKRIGQLVAEKLGIPCYYKEMTALAAQESGLAREFISGINSDENAAMRELYLSTSAVQQAVIAQDKAINMIADMGACVIVGRAADYVLRNRENVVRIFIHAPKPYRVKKVMEMYGDTEQEGKKNIARSESLFKIF